MTWEAEEPVWEARCLAMLGRFPSCLRPGCLGKPKEIPPLAPIVAVFSAMRLLSAFLALPLALASEGQQQVLVFSDVGRTCFHPSALEFLVLPSFEFVAGRANRQMEPPEHCWCP